MLWFPQLQYQSPGNQLLSRLCPQRPRRPAQNPRRLKFKFPQTGQIQSPGLAGPVAAACGRVGGGGTDSVDSTDPMQSAPDVADAAARGTESTDSSDPMRSFAYTPGAADAPARGRFQGGSTDSMDSSDPMSSCAYTPGASDSTRSSDAPDAADATDSWLHKDHR